MSEQSQSQSLTGNMFFDKIKKFDEKPKEDSKDEEMLGKSSNRKLEQKWNIKIQTGVDFFTEIFSFIKEMGYNVILGLTSKQIKLYKIDSSNTHLSYIILDKTEIAEYINTDNFNKIVSDMTPATSTIPTEENETLIYVEFDIIDEMSLNIKYPVDIYFDTKEKNTMYIINGKTLESRRLNDITNSDPTTSTYSMFYDRIQGYIKNENTFDIHISHIAFKNVLNVLDKKKTKKDKSSSNFLNIKFGLNDIDFLIGNEIKSSSVQMYGDDIIVRGTKNVTLTIQLDFLAKFNKLKLMNNVILHVNDILPLVLETKFGAGRIKLYYMIAPRDKSNDES